MIKELNSFLRRKQEMIIITLVAIALIICLIMFTDVSKIYLDNSLNSQILNIFGTLFGLLLTAYAILFGLIPALSVDTLESNSLKSVNFRFFLSLLINLVVIILGLSEFFVQGIILEYIIYLQLFLVIYLVLLFLLLIFYLLLLFKGAKNRASKS